MAKIGTVPPATRYAGLVPGFGTSYVFETQSGVPVDGGRALNRELSPFTISILPPDALIASAQAVEAVTNLAGVNTATSLLSRAFSGNVGAVGAAANVGNNLGMDRGVVEALSAVSLINTESSVLRSVIADGALLSDRGNEAFSSVVDAATAADIALQLQYILNAPPLTLLVNPTSTSLNYTKLQSYQSRGRYGYIFESWGMEQPKLSITGKTGGFVAGLADRSGVNEGLVTDGQVSSVSGYQGTARRDSAAWQQFMALYVFYRNNGYIFDTVGGSIAHLFIGALAITYDQVTYEGHFESFQFGFDEGMPHYVEFSAEFVVSRMYDSAQSPAAVLPQRAPTTSLSDPRYTRGLSTAGNNGVVDLVSRTEREQFTQSVQDVGQTPLTLLGGFSDGSR